MLNLYEHQIEALAALKNTIGNARVVIPTGGGKTLIEAYHLNAALKKKHRKTKIFVVLAPRIVLVNQLMSEYRKYIGKDYLALAFHSGTAEIDYEVINWDETSTTKISELENQFDRAAELKKHLVIFSTYASAYKLADYEIEMLICDESQYCVTENYYETVKSLNSKQKLFFTATERHTLPGGRGLNNEDVYGPVAYQIAPMTLIERNIIVPPRLHLMYAESLDKVKSVIDEVCQVASKQIGLTSADMPVTKILFAMRGTSEVKTISENVDKIKSEYPDFKIFTIVSHKDFGAQVDGVRVDRNDFLDLLRGTDKALIFHYDILAEGIDIDDITGVCILRNLKQAKLLQTIGRAVRIYKPNPELKKQAWVSVTAINGDEENRLFVMNVLNILRDGGFEINAEQIDITDQDGKGIPPDEDEIEDAYKSAKKKHSAWEFLDNVHHEIERAKILERINQASGTSLFDLLFEPA